jgi:hypothetical protein
MIMTVIRAIISFFVGKLGVTGLMLVVGFIVWIGVQFCNISFKLLWVMLTKSCS